MKNETKEDQKLLRLIKRDASKGLAELMDTYGGLIHFMVSKRLIGRPEDAEECVSDVFVEFYQKIDDIDLTKGSIKAYLVMMANRRAIDKHRRVSSNTKSETEDIDEWSDIIKDPAASPEIQTIETEKKEHILKEIEDLGEPDHEIIIRRYFLSESVKEIADSLGMKSNSVTKRIGRALNTLKERLEEYYYE